MFTVTALSVFISTEADYFILLRYLTKDYYCSMFESTWYLNHFWFFTIETFYTLWNFKKLLCIFTRLNNWLHINSCLKICTCTDLKFVSSRAIATRVASWKNWIFALKALPNGSLKSTAHGKTTCVTASPLKNGTNVVKTFLKAGLLLRAENWTR